MCYWSLSHSPPLFPSECGALQIFMAKYAARRVAHRTMNHLSLITGPAASSRQLTHTELT
ncbi:uncharacterized protein CLUP02_10627 [Colletotrichum lupini]|uniref:Uncharacterized protein n=1 Tax=Colletotrichum lupini TaxID=145971 RepID=A0A9Q8WJ22_9PEZI|nr:uncharacterized protein CLUP02_10627 [Colletotrichum lupini]UQC85131.1 hypothetical protein CLUP02_10627 [Colletotrichum lupini]